MNSASIMAQTITLPEKMNHNAGELPLPEKEKMDLGRGKRAMEFQHNELFRKRHNTAQWSFDSNVFPVPYPLYNPLNDPNPLGLRIKKSQALLGLIQPRLAQVHINSIKIDVTKDVTEGVKKDVTKDVTEGVKKDVKPNVKVSGPSEKLKASNFPATLLKIGNWEYKSQYECDKVNISSSKKDLTKDVTKGVKKDVKPKVKISGPNEKLKASNFPAALVRIGNWEYKSKSEGDKVNINSSKKDVTQDVTKGVKKDVTKDVTKVVKKDLKPKVKVSGPSEKLKASNFPAVLLRIGNWEYKSKYEGDLVAKCYFTKHKLVWEVLDGGLKSKIEMEWADIVGLKADCPDNGPGTLTVVLDKQPKFFRETDPQPRKHTIWLPTTDFTYGNASAYRQHYLYCAPGELNKHYEKLIRCDTRLSLLGQQSNASFEAPVEDPNVLTKNSIKSSNHIDVVKEYDHVENAGHVGSKAQVNAPAAHPAILPGAVNLNHMMENISRFLLTDRQLTAALDAKHLVSRVNSLCALAPDESESNGSNSVSNPATGTNQVNEWHDGNDHSNPGLTIDEIETVLASDDSLTDFFDMLPEIADL